MAVIERTYTADELLALSHSPQYDEKRLELSDGELIIRPFASAKHGIITAKIGHYIGTYVHEKQLGYMTAAGTGYVLRKNPDTVREPDVGFITANRLPDGLSDSFVPVAPDLAIEVVSPGESADENLKKVGEYLHNGTRIRVACICRYFP